MKDKNQNILRIITLLVLISIFTNCTRNNQKLIDNSILYAERKGVANCMIFLFFQKDSIVIQKSKCFGINTKQGKFSINGDTLQIFGLNEDKKKIALAIVEKKHDRIGHVIKYLAFYPNADTLSNPIYYNAYDDETKCPNLRDDFSKIDLNFIQIRFSKTDLFDYENSLNSKHKTDKFSLGDCYYSNSDKKELESPIVFERAYKSGLPLRTSYFYQKDTLIIQYHEWSDYNCVCINFDKKYFFNFYKQLINEIIKVKGEPNEIIGKFSDKNEVKFERIWDSEEEHLELHLYFYASSKIRLIKYWK